MHSVNVDRLDRHTIDVEVKLSKRFRVRMFLFLALFRLAIWIAPADFKLTVE